MMHSTVPGIRARAVLLAIVALSAGCSKGGAGGAGGFQMPPTPVEVATVERGNVVERFEAVGSMAASEEVVVAAEIQGIVAALPFEEGSPVRRGQVLAQLEDSELRAEMDRAEALRDQQKLAYTRWKQVVDQKAGAPQDLDDALARLKVTEADLALAQARLDKTRITAPFDGVAGPRRVSPGAFLNVGGEITSLAKMDQMRVTFSAPERFAPVMRRGARVTISVSAYPGETWEGTIDAVDPVLDSGTRSVSILARVRNTDSKLRPGMSANVSAVLAERPDALTVPSEAVYAEGEQFFVYLVNADSTVAPVPLNLGTRTASTVEVLGQLEPGAMIVRAGHQKLFPGAKVMPLPSAGGPGGPADGGAAAAAAEGDAQ